MPRAAPAYLRSSLDEDRDRTGFILGSVSAMDPLRGEEARLSAGDARWLRGISEEEVRRHYNELIHSTAADLLELVPSLEALTAGNALCVTAGKPLLEACSRELRQTLTL